MSDYAHDKTDRELAELERKIRREYDTARKEVQKKLNGYLAEVAKGEEKQRELLKAGKITKQEYNDWMTRKIGMGKRWEEMRDDLAQDMTNAGQIARSIADGYKPEVYALNHNWATYQIEHDGKIDTFYQLYDRQTVERLMEKDRQLMPPAGKRVKREIALGKAQKWNNKNLQSALTQSILQGEGIPDMAKRVARTVAVRSYADSVRYARTMITGAESAGRQDAYERAERMGIDLEKEWIATLDDRTRHTHRQLHGERRPLDEEFSNGCMYPADPSGDDEEVYNCRCTTKAQIKGFESDTVKSSPKMGEMSFEEWQDAKRPKEKETEQETIQVKYGQAVNGVKDKYRQSVIDALDNAPDNIKNAWNAFSDELRTPKYDLKGDKAHFAPWDKSTHYGSQKKAHAANAYQEENACYFHEYGHNIDFLCVDGRNKYFSSEFENGVFANTIMKECDDRVREFWFDLNGYADNYEALKAFQDGAGGMGSESYIRQMLRGVMPRDEYRALRNTLLDGGEAAHRDAFMKYLNDSEYIKSDIRSMIRSDKKLGDKFVDKIEKSFTMYERTDISDMFEKYMVENYNITYPFGVGHGKSYWKKWNGDDAVAHEAFAEMFSATATQNKSLRAIKEMFPESYGVFERMLEEVSK